MMMTGHVLLGGAMGEVIENPYAAFSLSVIVHVLIDKIPHFFPDKRTAQNAMIALDLIFATSALLFFWFGPFPKSVFFGGLGGVTVDIILVGIPIVLKSKLGQWHINRQPHMTREIFLLTDVALIVISVILLWSFK